MANDKKQFKRKLSAEEAGGNYILIQKKELDFFPKVGKPFKLQVGEKGVNSYIEAVECWCQGPKKPHSHYRLNASEFKEVVRMNWGAKIRIEKLSPNKFELFSS
ncbi:MAG: hypothetical protein E2O76_14035 [Caldithrix sp.]|nr:MAG: hypothetical protein E2O76_14035 [Caldithrix sp.]